MQSQLSSTFPNARFRTLIADAASTENTTASIKELIKSINDDDLNLTVLLNNVGGTANMRKDFTIFSDHTPKEIDDLITTNMLFTTHLAHALLPILTNNTPSLVLSTGSTSQVGMPYLPVYSATKAYLSAWSNALSIEMEAEKTGVEVLTVLSGNTQSGQDTRAANFWRPTSETFAKAALGKVGVGRSMVVGYFGHGVQAALMGWLPERVLRLAVVSALRGMKGKDLDEV